VFVALGALLAVWQFLAPTERKVMMPYSEFLIEVHAGKVREIRVQGRDIDYRLDNPSSKQSALRHTTGPVPDQAFLDTLKPTDPNAQQPRITFEK
jgi:cell division protease FtsH